MSTFGIATVKDESDVIAGTLLHMADEVDHMIVVDNASGDGTREILAELEWQLPLDVMDDPEVAYHQSARMSFLAAKAAERGADWIVPFDADELWYWRGGRIRDELADLKGVDIVEAALYNHFPSGIDPIGDDPFETICFRQAKPAPLPKVAFRWRKGATIHQGNHGVDLEGPTTRISGGLEIRHFPYRSAEQFVKKARNGAAAYAATDLPEHVGAHWRGYGEILHRHGVEALADVFREHFWAMSPVDKGWVPDPAPYRRWLSS